MDASSFALVTAISSLAHLDAVGRGHPPHQTLVSLTDMSNPAKCSMLRFSF
jgi:hypothetical protein